VLQLNQTAPAFGRFIRAFIHNSSVTLGMSGSAPNALIANLACALGNLSVSIPLQPIITTMAGIDGLPYVTVDSFTITGVLEPPSVPRPALAVAVQATMLNPSSASFFMGAVTTFGLYAEDGQRLGSASAFNATLVPGYNLLQLNGSIAPEPAALPTASVVFSRYLSGLNSSVVVVGESVSLAGAPTPQWLSDAIASISANATLPGGDIPLVHGVEVAGISMQATGLDTVAIDLNATVLVNNIMGPASPIAVLSSTLNVTMEDADEEALGQLLVTQGMGPTAPPAAAAAAASAALLSGAFHIEAAAGKRGPRSVGVGDGPLPILPIPLRFTGVLQLNHTAPAFGRFIGAFIHNSSVTLGLSGSAPNALIANLTCALGNLSVSIPLQPIITTMAGIDGLPYVTVDSFTITGVLEPPSVPRPALAVAMQATMLNPSSASFFMGAVTTFGLYAEDGQRLGSASAFNATLVPGYNVLKLNGSIAPEPAALPTASVVFSRYLNGLNSTLAVVGESVSLAGAPTPQWLSGAIASISANATLPGAANLTVFSEVQLVSMDLQWLDPPQEGEQAGQYGGGGAAFGSALRGAGRAALLGQSVRGPPSPAAVPYLGGVIAGNIHLPFTVPVAFPSLNLTLVFNDPATGVRMASVTLANQRAAYEPYEQGRIGVVGAAGGAHGAAIVAVPAGGPYPAVGRLTLFLDSSRVTVYDPDAFAGFMVQTLTSPSAPLLLTGVAAPTVSMAIGNMSITNVSIHQNTAAPGMNGYADPSPQILTVDITDTTLDTVSLAVTLNITNPSIVTGGFGPVTLALEYQGVTVASAQIADLQLVPGGNLVAATGVFVLPNANSDPVGYAAATGFVSDYLSGTGAMLRLLGSAASSPYPLLQPAFARFNTSCPFPGLPGRILVNSTLYNDINIFDIPTAPNGTLALYNPLAVDLTLLNSSLTVFLCTNESADGRSCYSAPEYGPPIGFFYNGDLSLRPPFVPAGSVTVTKTYPITLSANIFEDVLVLEQLWADGDAITKINGTITSRLGAFVSTLYFEEYGVPLFLRPANETPPLALPAPPQSSTLLPPPGRLRR
jgi:hypothetical protein